MVLCAGFGTRLRPLTLERPKPLVPIGDAPLLVHVQRQLAAAGLEGELVVNAHHLYGEFMSLIEGLGLELKVVREPEIRGTGGGVAGARALFESTPVLVWNGDILAQPDVAQLLKPPCELRLAVAPRAVHEGTVGVDRSGRVVRLRGEVFGEETRGGDYVGVLALGAEALSRLPDEGCLIGDLCLPWLRAGRVIETLNHPQSWTDLGTPDTYLNANLGWLEQRGLEHWVGSGAARSPAVRLERSLVGAGSQVEGAGSFDQCVVWPGARAMAPATRTIFTRKYRIEV